MSGAFSRLPEAMRRQDRPEAYKIALALMGWQDEIMAALASEAEDFFFNHVFWNTCKASSLDWAARFCGFDGEFWDSEWTEAQKRHVLFHFRMIWAYRGDPVVLQLMFDIFELDAKIRPNDGWILGGDRPVDPLDVDPLAPTIPIDGTPFQIRLSGSPLQFYIIIPPRYSESSPELKQIKKFRKLYLSNAVEAVYQYRASN